MTNELLSLREKKWEGLQYLGQVQNGVDPNEPDALYDALDHKLHSSGK